jgi:type IV fimbrial biogenesis protein FimT
MKSNNLSQSIQPSKGFTLVELMVVIAIMGVLMAIALPDFVRSTRQIQLSHQAKEMQTAIGLTRNEAMRRGQVVVMCRANTGLSACLTSGSPEWQGGWLIFNDVPNASGAVDGQYNAATETLISVKQAMSSQITVLAQTGVGNRIIFNPAGEAAGGLGNAQKLTFSHNSDPNVNNQVFLTVAKTGRARITTWSDCQAGAPC